MQFLKELCSPLLFLVNNLEYDLIIRSMTDVSHFTKGRVKMHSVVMRAAYNNA